MKKQIILLCMCGWLALVPLSCKKDSMPTPAKPPLLTRVSGNGITRIELSYDNERRLSRVNYYFNGTLSTYTLFEYQEAGIKEIRRYNADDHTLSYRRVLSLDNFGRIIKSENYLSSDPGEISSISEYDYNASDQLVSHDFRVPGNPVYTRDEYTYGDLGSRTSAKTIRDPGQPDEFLWYQYDYSPGDKAVPSEWNDYIALLSLPGLDNYLTEMFNTTWHYQSWDDMQQPEQEVMYETSGRAFNKQGYLTGQVITRKNILNPGPDQEQEMVYEYSQ